MVTGAEAIAARAQRSINFLINNEIYLSNKARTTLRYMSAKEKKSWTKGGDGPPGPTPKSAVEQIVYISTIWTERKEFLEATETQENTLVEVSVSMNTTANGASSWSCSRLINTVADKIGQTIAYNLILLSSRVGNSLIVLIIYKTTTLRRPINMLIANMAMSDLLFPIFLTPVRLTGLHVSSWPIGGNLGQALCKVHPFLTDVSTLVSIQSLVLITAERFGAVSGSSTSSTFHAEAMSLFDCWSMDTRSSLFFALFVCLQTCWIPRGNVVRASAGGSLWRDKLTFYLLLYPCCPLRDTLLHHPDQA